MKSLYLLSEFASTPWAIQPERLPLMAAVLARWATAGVAPQPVMESVRADVATYEARRGDASTRSARGNIAVLPLYGTVVQRTTASDEMSGGGLMSIQRYTQQLRAAVADDSVSGVLMDIDSPGGSVYGVQELAAEIMAARSSKPIYAVANSLAASAAYWIGAAASEFYVTPGGQAGSIGVYMAHRNIAAALEKEGVEIKLISAGKFKTEGNPYGPLSEEAEAYMQSSVDNYYGAFTRGVAKARGVDVAQVREGMGQGRVLSAADAVSAGMADGVMTFDDVLGKLGKAIAAPAQVKSGKTANARRSLDILSASF